MQRGSTAKSETTVTERPTANTGKQRIIRNRIIARPDAARWGKITSRIGRYLPARSEAQKSDETHEIAGVRGPLLVGRYGVRRRLAVRGFSGRGSSQRLEKRNQRLLVLGIQRPECLCYD